MKLIKKFLNPAGKLQLSVSEDGLTPEERMKQYQEGVDWINDYVKSPGFALRWHKQFPSMNIKEFNLLSNDEKNKIDIDVDPYVSGQLRLRTLGLLANIYKDSELLSNEALRDGYNFNKLAYEKLIFYDSASNDNPMSSYIPNSILEIDEETSKLQGPFYSKLGLWMSTKEPSSGSIRLNRNIDYTQLARDGYGLRKGLGEAYSRYIFPWQIGAHEASHNYEYDNLPDEWNKLINPSDVKPTVNAKHDDKERQVDARASKFLNYKAIGFDSREPNQEYTEDHYNKYLEWLKKNNYKDRYLDLVGKDNFIKAMNNFAYVKYNNNNNYV